MKIEIDTKRDSKDEIKKIIKMLHHLIEETAYFNSDTPNKEISSSYSSSEMPGLGFLGEDSPVIENNNREKEDKDNELDFDSLETF